MVRNAWQISVLEDIGALHLQIRGLLPPDRTISALSELLAAAQAYNIDKFLIDRRLSSSLGRKPLDIDLYLQFHRLFARHARKTAILCATHHHENDAPRIPPELATESRTDLMFFFEEERAFRWLKS